MSWQAVTWVLEQSEAELGSRLVMISIASHSNREGENAFPTLETIARETLMSEREVRYCIRALEEKGELRVLRGIGRGNPNKYDLPLVRKWVEQIQRPGGKYSKKGQNLPHFLNGKGAMPTRKGAICDNKRGNALEVNPTESETSSEQPLEPSTSRTVIRKVLNSLCIPEPSKPASKEELIAESKRQLEELRKKGFIQ